MRGCDASPDADCAGKLRQPHRHFCWIVVNDVINPRCSPLNRKLGRNRCVIHVYEGPDAGAVADERELALTHKLDHVTVFKDRSARARRQKLP